MGGFGVLSIILIGFTLIDPQFRLYLAVARNLGCIYGGSLADSLNMNPRDYSKFFNVTELAKAPPPLITHHCQTSAGAGQVLVFYFASMFAVLTLMTVIPRTRTRFVTNAGASSIYIYFGQGLGLICVIIPVWAVIHLAGFVPSIVGLLGYYLGTFAVWLLMSQPCAKVLCRPFIEPKIEKGCVALV